ncbi:carbamoyltransferase family protein [Roseateles sp. P5_D6]
MLVLGLSGGLDLAHERREHLFPPGICHDAAAVLAEDGCVVVAIEEERLNRIKHCSKGPVGAIASCLSARGVRLQDIDQVRYYGTEVGCETWMRNLFYGSSEAEPVTTYRQLIHEMFSRGLGETLDDNKLRFVHHHLAHATSAHAQSGFERSLTLTIDGAGDGLSGSVTRWQGMRHEALATYPEASSLGNFYDRVIQMLGYGFTEEYKVMGLAPYGDPQRFQAAFSRLYSLSPHGNYAIHWPLLESLYGLVPVRKRGQPFMQVHKDMAAALQQALEDIVMHMLAHWRDSTGLGSLCLAGGVAHNSTLNGKILYGGLFDEVFVQPASGDAGCALGAALSAFAEAQPAAAWPGGAARHVFWGSDIGAREAIQTQLERWRPAIEFEAVGDIACRMAAVLAGGEAIGWVQGRAEFGPRALGHRSILADPRPAANKDRINAMVKKREGYRPFAPSVLEERCTDFFELPSPQARAPFMSYTLRVRPEARELLGAVTHVDGTARAQTVSREDDPLFWALIEQFGRLTGVPVLLNTSFNNHAEPIVDSVDDAVASFLTTGLQRLAVGPFVVDKRVSASQAVLGLAPSLPVFTRLSQVVAAGDDGLHATLHELTTSFDRRNRRLSPEAYRLLRASDGRRPTAALVHGCGGDEATLAQELATLWEDRLILLRPPAL